MVIISVLVILYAVLLVLEYCYSSSPSPGFSSALIMLGSEQAFTVATHERRLRARKMVDSPSSYVFCH